MPMSIPCTEATSAGATFEPKVVAFVFNWCTYTGADLAGTSRLKMSTRAA